jgi:hypothetical protein
MKTNVGWELVRSKNPTYFPGSLKESEGTEINWHSPKDERSSQIFCLSAFGTLRQLPDGFAILNRFLRTLFHDIPSNETWCFRFEYQNRRLLEEFGGGTPTTIDVHCSSIQRVLCIESKFFYDANDGFGGCGQIRGNRCRGYYGPLSDRKTRSEKFCRLEHQDGKRAPRLYWTLGKTYFKDSIFREQREGDNCPFSGGYFQLMRNFLFAATAASNEHFGVVIFVPKKTQDVVEEQVESFKNDVLKDHYHDKIMLTHYDCLADGLLESPHPRSKDLGDFLRRRMGELL